MTHTPSQDLCSFLGDERFATVMADPPWRFVNRTGKVAPETTQTSSDPSDFQSDVAVRQDLNGEGQ